MSEDQALVAWGGKDDWEYAFESEEKVNNNFKPNGQDAGDGPLENGGFDRPRSLPVAIEESTKKAVRFNNVSPQDSHFGTPSNKCKFKRGFAEFNLCRRKREICVTLFYHRYA